MQVEWVQDSLQPQLETSDAIEMFAADSETVNDEIQPSCSNDSNHLVVESSDCGDDATNQELLSSSVSEDMPAAEKNDFEAFLNFSFPEDNEFSSPGDLMDPYYFESDHVALKGNEDYRRLLRAFVTLESQRTAALHDLDELFKLQRRALNDPLRFAEDLCRGTFKDKLPGSRRVAELPSIAWERYTSDVESVLSSFGGSHHMTRQKQKRELMNEIRQCVDEPSPAPIKTEPATVDKVDDKEVSRPATFNQAWSAEEQRKLENLLKKYPPERFESRRWAKIAKELPGRTTQQVASRVQKYFIKLARAGLPVPGRMPNVAAYGGRLSAAAMHRHQRYNRFLYPTSTFMTSYEPPIYMSDDDDDGAYDDMEANTMSNDAENRPTDDQAVDNDGDVIASCLRDTPEYRQLQALMAVQRQRRRSNSTSSLDGQTGGGVSADDEISGKIKSEPELEENTNSDLPRSGYVDPDYASSAIGISNYLDPNYMPSV